MANAIGFYCDTLNFVAIHGFIATAGNFCCERVTCCHKNHSVAIKFFIVATRQGIHNEKNMRCMQGELLHRCLDWLLLLTLLQQNKKKALLLLFSIVAIDSLLWQRKTQSLQMKHSFAMQIKLLGMEAWLLRCKSEALQLGSYIATK